MATRSASGARPFRWTRAWLARLPDDGNRYEALDGALLVTPSPRFGHQEVAARLMDILRPYCREQRVGAVVGPGAVVWGDNELQPDVVVIPAAQPPRLNAEWADLPLPLLVVEILSSGPERHDRHSKRDAYLGLGIPQYWMVDLDARTVFVWRAGEPKPLAVTGRLTWQPRDDAGPLTLDVEELLAG